MNQPTMRKYPAEFKERAVKLAVESDQPIAQTARDLGVNENTLHTWMCIDTMLDRWFPQWAAVGKLLFHTLSIDHHGGASP